MIISAAIKLKNGQIFTNKRHHLILQDMKAAGVDRKDAIQAIQGFINHKNEFLNREQAAIEAMECGQVVKGHANIRHVFNGRELFSEDYC